jgi:hypothetical protein
VNNEAFLERTFGASPEAVPSRRRVNESARLVPDNYNPADTPEGMAVARLTGIDLLARAIDAISQ